MKIKKIAAFVFLILISILANAQDINFEDLHRAGPGLVKSVSITGLASDADSYTKSFTDTDSSRREASRQASSNYSSSSSGSNTSSSSSSNGAGVASIRSETYDNVGRKTEGYWITCRKGGETRVYRSAWDNNRDWYKPLFPNGRFLASGNTSINQVAQNICS